jgi:hypothetical protein
MTCVTLALLGGVDERLRNRLAESKVLRDHLIGKAGADFLLATTEVPAAFEGVAPLQLTFTERREESLVALISASGEADFSWAACRTYADPYNTPGLVDDARIGDGFIVRAGRNFDIPEDGLRLLRALKAGGRIDAVFRRDGERSAAMDRRLLLARCGPGHPALEDILTPLKSKAAGARRIHVLPFSLKDGRITVDNTYKPKTVKLPPKP